MERMSKIVYLLGAGASYGDRARDKNGNITKQKVYGDVDAAGVRHIKAECVGITEGLPLVVEIPGRLAYIIEKIKECPCAVNIRNLALPLGFIDGGVKFDTAKEMLIKDLEWLRAASENHATIDTFAKKLYLKGQLREFAKVENLLSIFFIIEQIINKKDGRYDTFLASVLDLNLNIDDRITILTWNYDSQFELAYKEYGEEKAADRIRKKLGIADLKDTSYETRNQIFKLNGTANFMQRIDLNQYQELDDELLLTLLDAYIQGVNVSTSNSRISFAWDNKQYISKNFEEALQKAIQDAEVLVVIGYTFPFFNREIDRKIFNYMTNLKKIYIQDPNAEQIISSLDSLYSIQHTAITHVNDKVKPIKSTSQFYLPPEL